MVEPHQNRSPGSAHEHAAEGSPHLCHDAPVAQLVLGTAQWGMDYGVTNATGRLSDDDLSGLMEAARDLGIDAVDTALGYGDAQVRVGAFAGDLWISTKVSATGDVGAQVGVCLEQLGLTSVDAVLLHDWDVAQAPARSAAIEALGECADEGLVGAVGVSVYGSSGLGSAIDEFGAGDVALGIVQVPANALDRRLDQDAVLSELSRAGCIVQVRSAFLQGVLLNPAGTDFHAHPDVAAFTDWADTVPGGALWAALGHVRALPWVSQVVVGATSADELREIGAAWQEGQAIAAPAHVGSSDERLIDPRNW